MPSFAGIIPSRFLGSFLSLGRAEHPAFRSPGLSKFSKKHCNRAQRRVQDFFPVLLINIRAFANTIKSFSKDWLCFFGARKRDFRHNSLLTLNLTSFRHPANWLCFFKFLLLILTLSAERRTLNDKIGFVFSNNSETHTLFLCYFSQI